MRLIDAELAEKNFARLMELPDDYVGPSSIKVTVDTVFSFLGQQRTVDPVKRGHWEYVISNSADGALLFKCSECGTGLNTVNPKWLSKFCSNCGAKMDE